MVSSVRYVVNRHPNHQLFKGNWGGLMWIYMDVPLLTRSHRLKDIERKKHGMQQHATTTIIDDWWLSYQ